jgi:hypothetical protein
MIDKSIDKIKIFEYFVLLITISILLLLLNFMQMDIKFLFGHLKLIFTKFMLIIIVILSISLIFFGIHCLTQGRKELRKLYSKSPLICLLLILIFTLNCSLILSFFVFFYPIYFIVHSDYFSQLLTVHSTLFSVIIALTLVIIQLNTQKYSFRVFDFFKELKEIWIFFGFFTLAIFLDLLISIQPNPCTPIIIVFGLFTFLSIFPYFFILFAIMKPDNFMERMSDKISLNDFDQLITILEILNISIDRKEYAVADGAIWWIEKTISEGRLNFNTLNKDKFCNENRIYQFIEVVGLIKAIRKTAFKLKDDYPFMELRIVKLLYFFENIEREFNKVNEFNINASIDKHFNKVYH